MMTEKLSSLKLSERASQAQERYACAQDEREKHHQRKRQRLRKGRHRGFEKEVTERGFERRRHRDFEKEETAGLGDRDFEKEETETSKRKRQRL